MADHPRGYSHDRRPAGVPQAPPPAAEAAPGSASAAPEPTAFELGAALRHRERAFAEGRDPDAEHEIDRQFGVDLHALNQALAADHGLALETLPPVPEAPVDAADIETADLTEVAHQVAEEPWPDQGDHGHDGSPDAVVHGASDLPIIDPLPPQGLPGDDNLL